MPHTDREGLVWSYTVSLRPGNADPHSGWRWALYPTGGRGGETSGEPMDAGWAGNEAAAREDAEAAARSHARAYHYTYRVSGGEDREERDV